MKIFIVLSLCVVAALGCSDLPELAICNKPGCSCEAGLSCVLTKNVIEQGAMTPVKQCIPEGTQIELETIDVDNQINDAPMRTKRWLYFNRCLTEDHCSYDNCCAFNKRCIPKLRKFMTCHLTDLHKCGCADGLVCTETASVTLPITGIKLALKQCRDAQ